MLQQKNLKLRISVIGVLLVLSALYIIPPREKLQFGLDLEGGMYLLLRADTSKLPQNKVSSAIEVAREVIRNRIDEFGVKEPMIQVQGNSSLLIQLPGEVDRARALKLIGQTAFLEFRLVVDDEDIIQAAEAGDVPQEYEWLPYQDSRLLVHKEVSVTGADLSDANIEFDNRMLPNVTLELNSQGTDKFAKVTRDNVGKRLAIVLDGKIKSAPSIRQPIPNGKAVITGKFTIDEARDLAVVLRAGALPCPLILEEERTVGPLLGADSVRRGINSIMVGVILVALFIIIYYRLSGIISVICLILDLLFVLGALCMFRATLTLPGIAGLILTLGMAVDANVLIFERMREELSLGKPLSLAVKNGFDKAKRTIFDANITTLIAAFFLFIYGTGPIRGFATTLFIGIIVSMFTAVFVGRTIFYVLIEQKLQKISMASVIHDSKINFIKMRKVCLVVSAMIIAVGMLRFHTNKEAMYGIDFKGGQILEYQLTPAPNIEEVRSLLTQNGITDITLQEFRDVEGGVIIKSKEDITERVESVFQSHYKSFDRLNITTIGPSVGNILKRKAFLAMIFSIIGILIYVAFRFHHFDSAFAGVIALFHDVFVSIAFLAFFGYEISMLTVTALLTIAGYSINDTIVVYDRIRELSARMQKISLRELINTAINQVLSRTIITSLTTVLVVLAIYVLGGEALKGFSFTLLVGFIAGTYSSIYIASPLVLLFRKSGKSHKN